MVSSAGSLSGCPGPDPHPRPPAWRVPDGAIDCHAHVFGPSDRFALDPDRSYTPPDSPLERYLHMLDAVGFGGGVLVQPSVYGRDNACLLDALERSPRLCGVIVSDPRTLSTAEAQRLYRAGVRGIRLNMVVPGGLPVDELEAITARLADFGWHLDFIPDRIETIEALESRLRAVPCVLVIEQMGRVTGEHPVSAPAFRSMLRLTGDGHAWVKLSHGYHISRSGPPYHDTIEFAQSLVAANSERVIWGSDWPHPMVFDAMPNDGELLDLFGEWVPDTDARKSILVDNPRLLYDFDPGRC